MRCTSFIALLLTSLNVGGVSAAKLCYPKKSSSSTLVVSTTRDSVYSATKITSNTDSDTLTTLDGASFTTPAYVSTPVITLSTTPGGIHSTTPGGILSTTPGNDPSTPNQTPSSSPTTEGTVTTSTTTPSSSSTAETKPAWLEQCKVTGFCTPARCNPNVIVATFTDVDEVVCADLCLAILSCMSFRFLPGKCDIFDTTEEELRSGTTPDSFDWYDKSCLTGLGVVRTAISESRSTAALAYNNAARAAAEAQGFVRSTEEYAAQAQADADAAQAAVAQARALQPNSPRVSGGQSAANVATDLAKQAHDAIAEAEAAAQESADAAKRVYDAAQKAYRATTEQEAQAAVGEATVATGEAISAKQNASAAASKASGLAGGALGAATSAEGIVSEIINPP